MYIAIDIGGTNTRIGSFKELDPSSKVGYKKIPTNQDYEKGFRDIKNIINTLAGAEKIEAIGISMALPLSSKNETVFTVNLSAWGWDALKLAQYLKSEFQTTTNILNDASAGAVGEIFTGNHKYTDFLFLTWGTGLGGVYIKKEQKHTDIYEFEPGHLVIINGGRECICGKRGCLQAYIGGKAIQDIYSKSAENINDLEWEEILDYMKMGINIILEKYPVNNIVLDGRTAIEHPAFVKKLERTLSDNYPAWVNFEQSSVGDEAPLYGALMTLDKNLDITFHKEF